MSVVGQEDCQRKTTSQLGEAILQSYQCQRSW